ncbi:formimidoylglutamate deiminase [Notoacmeibacter sp. MSK16QG-6]|uniref:formimidoylglutamate deiminase n=1 Tax=Notoacmeibacter sp. MSK16QG-6 TaxID=2957982 RepID=UPI0020A205F6|nr:formimidoylglutamate deiminase [Notoacmeibacter sp. MSK16QG-6]MCP1200528.1 formimidoylglutamate deiminase [Notoacmeibacter sp. MSK16QG-6]
MQHIWANQALVGGQWRQSVAVEIDEDGRISAVTSDAPRLDTRVDVLLPAPANLHSHAFQRAMAGLTERRGPEGRDTFWTWRQLMFRFLEELTPEDIEAIAAYVQMEMMEAGYASVGEFHYLHHQPDGTPYDDIGELSARIAAAAEQSGIGLTLLPVLYGQGGCDGAPLRRGQARFGNRLERFAKLYSRAEKIVDTLSSDSGIGVAPHSLRAVNREELADVISLATEGPLHMHLAEQVAEVDEVQAAYGQRPVHWLLDHHEVSSRWCLIHCTQMTETETVRLARTGAVAGLCPITESSLGDGIFNAAGFLAEGGRFGIGSDSNIRIALSEELRTLEYSQRLRDRHRAILSSADRSTGRLLFDEAVRGGAQALGRRSGEIAVGHWADLLALNTEAVDLEGKAGDTLLDAYVFAGDDRMVSDLWTAGRHMVREGRHVARARIEATYRKVATSLLERI